VKDLVLGPDKKTPTFDFMRKRRWFTFPSSILMPGAQYRQTTIYQFATL
jgi:hypothetical protein